MMSKSIAQALFQKKISLEEMSSFLSHYKREYLFPRIVEELKRLRAHDEKQSTLRIETAFPLSKEAEKHIQHIVGNEKARTKVTTNEHLLAGFRALYKGKRYEKSARRILDTLCHESQRAFRD